MNLHGEKVAVCGAGGFIGGHMVKKLLELGANVVRAIDIKPVDEWYQSSTDVENLTLDLKDKDNCYKAAKGASVVFQLAADMGGMGFIENNKALCMLSVLTNTHMLMAARDCGVERFFYSSSACVYNAEKQKDPRRRSTQGSLTPIRRFPKTDTDGRSCSASACAVTSRRTSGCNAGLHDITMSTGRMAPGPADARRLPLQSAGRCSKQNVSGKHEIEIWGDGNQTRSFMYIDDCMKGTKAITESEIHEPLNLGSNELVTINQLVDIVQDIAGLKLKRNYQLDAPKGVSTVGHRVRVDVQQPGRALRAVVLPEVAGERGQVLRLVLVLVVAELAEHLGGERPQLAEVGHLQ